MKVGRLGRGSRGRAFESAQGARGQSYFADSSVYGRSATSRIRGTSRCRCSARRPHGKRDPSRRGARPATIQAPPPEAGGGDARRPARHARAPRPDREESRSTRRARCRDTASRGKRSKGLLTPEGDYFFMEMKHPPSRSSTPSPREVTGPRSDPASRFLIAAGEPLIRWRQEGRRSLRPGTSIECRIQRPRTRPTASCPAPGRITSYREAVGAGACASDFGALSCGLGDRRALRPDDREADRARHEPRGTARRADAPCAVRVRDRRPSRRCSASTRRSSHTTASSAGRGHVTASSSPKRLAQRAEQFLSSGNNGSCPPRTDRCQRMTTVARKVDGKGASQGEGCSSPSRPIAPLPRRPPRGAPAVGRERAPGSGPPLLSPNAGNRGSRSRVARGATVVADRSGDLHRRGDEDGETR